MSLPPGIARASDAQVCLVVRPPGYGLAVLGVGLEPVATLGGGSVLGGGSAVQRRSAWMAPTASMSAPGVRPWGPPSSGSSVKRTNRY